MMLMHEIFHTNFPSPGKCTLQFWRAVAVCPHEGDAQEDVPWPSPLLVSAFAVSSCRTEAQEPSFACKGNNLKPRCVATSQWN